ncbi:hypothetical protein Rhe02_78390 [Rhizocola hellebori]|uniref:Uncharacterized protein n=1 Tax=Rhizocola hellebori TaxID=1392758 RepID=A0A8J3QHL9_9ACTN|nr:hypothetical protein Rhe02_78390 [Rhizocola hellebori]
MIRIKGDVRDGTRIVVPDSGRYRFVYREGSYSTYPENAPAPKGILTWRTAIYAFRNGGPTWNGQDIRQSDAFAIIADTGDKATLLEVETAAAGSQTEVEITAGDYLSLVGVDGYSYYSGNPGTVTLEWFRVTYS